MTLLAQFFSRRDARVRAAPEFGTSVMGHLLAGTILDS
jgi:hypothetical protein